MSTRKIETEVILSGEKAFNDGMKSINNNLKNLDAEMRVVSTAFDENASATDKLKARQNILTQQIDQQREKVRALNEMYERQKAEYGENSAAADKYRQQTLNAQAALNKMEAELRQTNKQLDETSKAEKKTGNEAKEAAGKYKLSAEALQKIYSSAKSVGSALGTAGKKLAETGAAAAKIGLKGTTYGLVGLGAAAGAASIGIAALGAKGFKSLISMSLEAANSEWSFWRLRNSMSKLKSAAEDAKSGLAEVMAPALESFTKKAADLLKEYNKEIDKAEGDTEAMGRIMARYLRRGAELVRDEAPAFIKAGGGLLKGLTSGIIENEDELEAVAGELISQITDFLDDNADDMGKAAAVLVSSLADLVGDNAPALFDAGLSMLESLLSGLDGEDMGEKTGAFVGNLVAKLVELAPDFLSVGAAFLGGVVDGLVEAWPAMRDAFNAFPEKLREGMQAAWDNWKGPGKDAIQATLEGMQAAWQSVVDWFNNAVSSLKGNAEIGITYHDSSSGRQHGGHSGNFATGLNYVPADNYLANLHEGEMVAPKPLATALRAAGINKNTRSLDGFGSSPVAVENRVTVEFTGSLAQLGRVLQPHIKAEDSRRGPAFVK